MTPFDKMPAENRIRRSRTMLVLGVGDEPFYGSIALGLELYESHSVPTAVTDGKVLIYNPSWIETIDTIEEVMGFVEHEVLHGALKHPIRRVELTKQVGEDNFDLNLWQMAADYAINPILIKKGRKLPGKPLYDPRFEGMSAERIYFELLEEKKACQQPSPCPQKGTGGNAGQDDQDQQPPSDGTSQTTPDMAQTQNGGSSKSDQKQQGSPGGSGAGTENDQKDGDNDNGENQENNVDKKFDFENEVDPGGCGGVIPPMDMDTEKPLEGKDLKDFQKEFEGRVVNAARQIEKNQGDVPGFLKDIVEAHTTPQVTYKDHLWDIMEEITKDDYSMSRPNKKFDEIYLPTMYDKEIGELIVVVDTSGSVSRREQEIYASEISGILEEFQNLSILVIYHDTRVRNTQELAPEDLPIKLEIKGGGGTSYHPVFEHIEKEGLDPKAIIWFTDLWVTPYTYSLCTPPDCELFWLNTSAPKRRSNPPFGTVIDLDPNV